MKIAYFTSNRTTFPPDASQIAASTTVTINIIERLKTKHEITLYAAKGSQIDKVHIIDLNTPPIVMDSATADSDWITKAVMGMKQIYLGAILKDAQNYDLIHIQTEPIYLGWHLANLVKTPILFTSHNTYHEFEKEIFTYYDKKIQFSGLSHAQIKRMPFSMQVPVIHNGIDLNQFEFNIQSENYFLFLGRLNEDKGITNFLKLSSMMPEKKFLIAGKGKPGVENKIKTAIEKNGNIKFLGMVPRMSTKWKQLLKFAKALIMPINYEDTCPLVPIEAMAFGTPIIAFDRGALPEQVVDSKTGYLVNSPSNNTKRNYHIKQTGLDGLQEAVERIYTMPIEEYTAMRKTCRMNAEQNFSIEKMVDGYEKLYEELIKKSSRSHS